MALYYCKKCGRIIENSNNKENFQCDCCKCIIFPVPSEFLDKDLDCFFKDDETEQQFIDKYIKTAPEFDKYFFTHRDEILAKQTAEFDAKMEHGRAVLNEQANVPKCPTCGSANLKRISTTTKVMSVALFGFLSTKRSRTFHCNNCGYEW